MAILPSNVPSAMDFSTLMKSSTLPSPLKISMTSGMRAVMLSIVDDSSVEGSSVRGFGADLLSATRDASVPRFILMVTFSKSRMTLYPKSMWRRNSEHFMLKCFARYPNCPVWSFKIFCLQLNELSWWYRMQCSIIPSPEAEVFGQK